MTVDCTIIPLTAVRAAEHVEALLAIDQDVIGERWTRAHVLTPMPGKWELSQLALDAGKRPAGFLIASQKREHIHVHRLAVAESLRGKGIGVLLLRAAASPATERGLSTMTLKVAEENASAIRFYLRLGFTETGRMGANLVMSVGLEQFVKQSGGAA
ncbi:MAG: GNAT family N-acetyltransferase [Bacteroidota bacterium]